MLCPFTRIVPILGAALVSISSSQASAQTPPPSLSGTSWQLVRIQSMDDKVATPSDRSKYTMTLAPTGASTCASTAIAGAARGNPRR